MCLNIFVYFNILLNNYVKKRKSAYRYANWAMQWMLMRHIHEMLAGYAGYADPDAGYPDADPDAT